jgi:hypothetical protein
MFVGQILVVAGAIPESSFTNSPVEPEHFQNMLLLGFGLKPTFFGSFSHGLHGLYGLRSTPKGSTADGPAPKRSRMTTPGAPDGPSWNRKVSRPFPAGPPRNKGGEFTIWRFLDVDMGIGMNMKSGIRMDYTYISTHIYIYMYMYKYTYHENFVPSIPVFLEESDDFRLGSLTRRLRSPAEWEQNGSC